MTYLQIRNRIQELIWEGKVNFISHKEDTKFSLTMVATPDTLKEIAECFIKLDDQKAPSAKGVFNKPDETTTRMIMTWESNSPKALDWYVRMFGSLKGFTR